MIGVRRSPNRWAAFLVALMIVCPGANAMRVPCNPLKQATPETDEFTVLRYYTPAWAALLTHGGSRIPPFRNEILPMVAHQLMLEDPTATATKEQLDQRAAIHVAKIRDLLTPAHTNYGGSLISLLILGLQKITGLGGPMVMRPAMDNLTETGYSFLPVSVRELLQSKLFRPQSMNQAVFATMMDAVYKVMKEFGEDNPQVAPALTREIGSKLSVMNIASQYPALLTDVAEAAPWLEPIKVSTLDEVIFHLRSISYQNLGLHEGAPPEAVELLLRVFFRRAIRPALGKHVLEKWRALSVSTRDTATMGFLTEEARNLGLARFAVEAFSAHDTRVLYLPDLVATLREIPGAAQLRDKRNALESVVTTIVKAGHNPNPVTTIRDGLAMGSIEINSLRRHLKLTSGWYADEPMANDAHAILVQLAEGASSEADFEALRQQVFDAIFKDSPPRQKSVYRLRSFRTQLEAARGFIGARIAQVQIRKE